MIKSKSSVIIFILMTLMLIAGIAYTVSGAGAKTLQGTSVREGSYVRKPYTAEAAAAAAAAAAAGTLNYPSSSSSGRSTYRGGGYRSGK